MQNYTQIKQAEAQARMQAQMLQQQAIKETNDLMNSTMSRCFAAYVAQGHNVKDSLQLAQIATQQFGLALGILKEKENDNRGQDNSGSSDSGRIITDPHNI